MFSLKPLYTDTLTPIPSPTPDALTALHLASALIDADAVTERRLVDTPASYDF